MQTSVLLDNGQSRSKGHKRKWSIGLDRSFSEEELQKFLSVVKNEKLRLVYILQAYLGLRISEAVRINIKDINFERKEIRVWNAKTKEMVTLYLHEQILAPLGDFIAKNMSEIEENGGFVTYSETKHGGPVSDAYARTNFKRYLKEAGIADVYAVIPATGNQCLRSKSERRITERKLYRLSTHSLRHYYITRCYTTTKDPLLTQQMARHRSFSSTECYIRLSANAVKEGMMRVFEGAVPSTHKTPQEEQTPRQSSLPPHFLYPPQPR